MENLEKIEKLYKAHVSHNTGKNNEWYTPQKYIDAARKTMGSIDLDPASSDIANRTVQATNYYTKNDDGLSKPWFGNIWLNPPYSTGLIEKFAFAVKNKRYEYDQAIILVNNATETKWFHELTTVAIALCLVKPRIKFLDENGNPGSPLQGQVILYIGSDYEKFIENFSQFGKCLIKHDHNAEPSSVLGCGFDDFQSRFQLLQNSQDLITIGGCEWRRSLRQDFMSAAKMFNNHSNFPM